LDEGKEPNQARIKGLRAALGLLRTFFALFGDPLRKLLGERLHKDLVSFHSQLKEEDAC